jgi:hypothetical protein
MIYSNTAINNSSLLKSIALICECNSDLKNKYYIRSSYQLLFKYFKGSHAIQKITQY